MVSLTKTIWPALQRLYSKKNLALHRGRQTLVPEDVGQDSSKNQTKDSSHQDHFLIGSNAPDNGLLAGNADARRWVEIPSDYRGGEEGRAGGAEEKTEENDHEVFHETILSGQGGML